MTTTLTLTLALAFALIYGVGVPSGLFVPGILIGCGLGRFVGEVVKYNVLPCEQVLNFAGDTICASGFEVHAGPYALMGACAMLGGVSRMTMSLTIILLETTQSVEYLLPIMLTLVVSKWVGDLFNISLYDIHLELRCMPFIESNAPKGMQTFSAGDVASRPVVALSPREPARRLLETLDANTHGGYPVCNERGELIGFVLRTRLVRLLTAPPSEWAADGTLPIHAFTNPFDQKNLRVRETEVPAERLAGEIDLVPYMDEHPLSVHRNFPLAKVHTLFRTLGLRHLVVTNTDGTVYGIVTRKELMSAFQQDLN